MDQIDLKKLQGWPFWWIGVAISVAYLLALTVFFGRSLSQLFGGGLSPNELGDSLAGIFAPLALVWLIVGILQQGRELRIQVQDLKESVDAQKAMAKASGGQERLQNEQFLERTYRLYKAACEDLLFQVLTQDNLRYGRSDGGSSILVEYDYLRDARKRFQEGVRSEVLDIVRAAQRELEHQPRNREHASFLKEKRGGTLLPLVQDFIRFDDLRIAALKQFQGGEVLLAVDEHEGFGAARKLLTSYKLLLEP